MPSRVTLTQTLPVASSVRWALSPATRERPSTLRLKISLPAKSETPYTVALIVHHELRAGAAAGLVLGECTRRQPQLEGHSLRAAPAPVGVLDARGRARRQAGFVAEQRAHLIALTQALAQDLDLDARLEIATDPFFVSEAASKWTFQAMNSTKLEFKLAIDATSSTAAGSFNLHGRHFTEPMQIADGQGEVLETACIAWGVERWMAAVISRHGPDAANWPI